MVTLMSLESSELLQPNCGLPKRLIRLGWIGTRRSGSHSML
jgi:hypothetical protein